MKGTYHISVRNRYLKYELDIRRNLTVIQGNSATGKTTLIELIREYSLDTNSGIQLSSAVSCRVLEGTYWHEQLSAIKESIVFIDEGSSFVETEEFAVSVKNSSNYYVIVTRENLDMLPISVSEVYGIKSSGKYGMLEPVYHEMYHIYDLREGMNMELPIEPELILTEDSSAGFEFFSSVCRCINAGGKSNIFSAVSAIEDKKETLIVADGAAFAPQMNRLKRILRKRKNIHLYLPESFEWLLLSAGIPEILKDGEVKRILANPSEYIDSNEYFSWERFFTALIVSKTRESYLKYNKSKLNKHYLDPLIKQKIMDKK